MKKLILLSLLALGACADMSSVLTKVQVEAVKVEPELKAACDTALMVANLAGLFPGVGAIVPYVNAGCNTAEGLTKLAADPSSTGWVKGLIDDMKLLTPKEILKL